MAVARVLCYLAHKLSRASENNIGINNVITTLFIHYILISTIIE